MVLKREKKIRNIKSKRTHRKKPHDLVVAPFYEGKEVYKNSRRIMRVGAQRHFTSTESHTKLRPTYSRMRFLVMQQGEACNLPAEQSSLRIVIISSYVTSTTTRSCGFEHEYCTAIKNNNDCNEVQSKHRETV